MINSTTRCERHEVPKMITEEGLVCLLCNAEKAAREKGQSPLFVRLQLPWPVTPETSEADIVGKKCDTEIKGKIETIGTILSAEIDKARRTCVVVVELNEIWAPTFTQQLEDRGRRDGIAGERGTA